MPRYFHIDEARKLLGAVDRLIGRACLLKEEHDSSAQQMQAMQQRVAEMGGVILDRRRMAEHRSRREEAAAELKAIIDQVHEMGVQVKDLDIGLVDFPTLYRDQEVLLCWKRGEQDIEYWHGLEEGFRGRKAIDREFLDNHHGDAGD
ncbi:MAG: DUF2203 domain-containing protein [Bryobacteraceae bacterium]